MNKTEFFTQMCSQLEAKGIDPNSANAGALSVFNDLINYGAIDKVMKSENMKDFAEAAAELLSTMSEIKNMHEEFADFLYDKLVLAKATEEKAKVILH